MKSPLLFLSLVTALLLSSCADPAWMAERQAAKNVGGRHFTHFCLLNIREMHKNLNYVDETEDLKEAYRHGNAEEKRLLQKRYNQVMTAWNAEEAAAQQRSRAWAAAASGYQAPSSSSYQPSSSTSYQDALDRNKRMHDQDTINRLRNNQQQLRSNPNTSY